MILVLKPPLFKVLITSLSYCAYQKEKDRNFGTFKNYSSSHTPLPWPSHFTYISIIFPWLSLSSPQSFSPPIIKKLRWGNYRKIFEMRVHLRLLAAHNVWNKCCHISVTLSWRTIVTSVKIGESHKASFQRISKFKLKI